jgi:organic radical activating enzyme
MKLQVQDLILEVTRRCNMVCRHCMRGQMQQLDMNRQVVDRLLESVDSIDGVTFTGGEPLLNVSIIRYFTDELMRKGISLGHFFVVTNGKKFDRDFVDCLIDLYDYCSNDDDDMCGLEISQDQFHEEVEIPKLYKALKFFRPDARKENYRFDSILKSGLARLNGIGRRKSYRTSWSIESYDDETIRPEMVYIAANGNVYHDCDASYYQIDKYNSGNVLKESLVDIVARQVKPEEEAIAA